jgi:hypothetical protein
MNVLVFDKIAIFKPLGHQFATGMVPLKDA